MLIIQDTYKFFFLSDWGTADVQLYVTFVCTTQWFTTFKGCIPRTLIIKYWLLSLCCTAHPCGLFILHISLHLLTPPHRSCPHFLSPPVTAHLFWVCFLVTFTSWLGFSDLTCSVITQCLSFCLTCFTQHNTLQVHPCYSKRQVSMLFTAE